MASPKQQVQNNGGSNSDDDDNIFGKIFHFFMPKNGGGFDFFGMIFNAVIWGAVLFGLYNWVIKPHKEDIGKWLDGVNPALGNGFRTAMTGIDKALGGAGGGLTNVIGNMFPKWANDQAMNEQDDAKFKEKYTKDMPPALADFITANRQVLLPILANASGDPNKPIFLGAALKPENLPKTLPALLKNFPREKMQQLLVAMLQPGATPGASSKMTNDVIATLLTSKDPAMQDVRQQIPGLLQSIQGSVTDPAMHGLVQFLAGPAQKPTQNIDALKNFADTVGEDKFNNLITALTTVKDGKIDFNSDAMKAVQDAVKTDSNYYNALKAFANKVDFASLSGLDQISKGGATASSLISGIKMNPPLALAQAAKAAATDTPSAPTDTSPPAGGAAPGGPAAGPANKGPSAGGGKPAKAPPAAAPAASAIDLSAILKSDFSQMNADNANALARAWEQSSKNAQDAATKFLAFTQGTDAHGQPNHPNMVASMEFMRKVQQDDKGGAQITAPDQAVILKLQKYLGGDKNAINPGDAPALAAFFRTPGNMQAFIDYTGAVRSTDPVVGPFLKVLHDHLHHAKSAEGGTGIEQIFTDEKSLNVMLQAITRPDHKVTLQVPVIGDYTFDVSASAEKSDPNDFVQNTKKAATKKALESVGYAPLADNYADIQALSASLNKLSKAPPQRS